MAAQKSYEIPSPDEAQLDRSAAELRGWIPASEVSAAKGVLGVACFVFVVLGDLHHIYISTYMKSFKHLLMSIHTY